ncbi:MAG: ribonuclease HII [Candidatus Norongarragalinales archaeon]
MLIAGADDTGRGCVFGSMFICAFAIDDAKENELRKMGVKDSKVLSPQVREKLYAKLIKMGDYAVVEYSAEKITLLMRRKVSLNTMEAAMVAEALSLLREKPKRVFVDSPDPEPRTFEKRIRKFFDHETEIVCENKADVKYPVVSAASIIGKVLRDNQITRLHKEIGDFGSGYTHDPRTIAFLKKNFQRLEVQKHLRQEWSTIRKNHAPTGQAKLGDF